MIETNDLVGRLTEWLKATAELAQSPGVDPEAFMELVGKGAAGLLTEVQSLSDRIAVLEGRAELLFKRLEHLRDTSGTDNNLQRGNHAAFETALQIARASLKEGQ